MYLWFLQVLPLQGFIEVRISLQNLSLPCVGEQDRLLCWLLSHSAEYCPPFSVLHYKGDRTNCWNILIQQSIVTILCDALQRGQNKLQEYSHLAEYCHRFVCCITKDEGQTVGIILIQQSIVTVLCAALQRTKDKLSESFSFSRILLSIQSAAQKMNRTYEGLNIPIHVHFIKAINILDMSCKRVHTFF